MFLERNLNEQVFTLLPYIQRETQQNSVFPAVSFGMKRDTM